MAVTGAGDAASVEYELPGEPKIHVSIKYRLQTGANAVALVREVAIRADGRLKEDLTVSLPNWPARLPADTWLPLSNGAAGRLVRSRQAMTFRGRCLRTTRVFPFRW